MKVPVNSGSYGYPFRRAAALLAAALWLGAAGGLAAADWPLARADAARTGFNAEQAYPQLTQAWSFDVQGDVVGSPVVYGGLVYFGARSGDVYALNAYNGELVWDYSADDWIDAAPAVSSGTVFAAGRDSRLYALDRLTGALKWKAELGSPSVSSPLPLAGRVFVGCGAPVKKLRAFDAATGALLWERQAAQPVDAPPATDGTGVYAASNDGRVYAMNPATGADLWPAPGYYQTIGSFGMNPVAVSDGYLYALPGHDERKLFKLAAADGSQAAVSAPFAAETGVASENEVTAPLLSPYGVFAGAGSAPQTLYAFDPASLADLAFSSPTAGNTMSNGLLSSPAMADNVMYLGTVDARLIAVSSAGAVLQEIALSSSAYSSPAVANGYVYIGVNGGRLYAFKAKYAAAVSSPRSYEVVDGTVAVAGYLRNPVMDGYALYYGGGASPASWTQIATAAASGEIAGGALGQWDVSALPNGLYTLKVSVSETSPSGTLPEGRVTVRVNHVPQPPSALAAADIPSDSGNRLRLSWTASPSSWVTAYRIYRAAYGGTPSYLAQVSTPAVAYVDAAAVTGSTFTYQLTAWDGYSESAPSARASAFSVDNNPASDAVPPAAVTDLAAAPGGAPGSVSLVWTGSGDDGTVGSASGYAVRYATYAAFSWSAGQVWKSSRAATGPYGTAEAEDVGHLFGGVTYYFLIEAYDGNANFSGTSNYASGCAPRDLYPPAAPADLVVADRPGDHGGALTLTWTRSADDGAGAGDVYGYRIFRSQESGGTASGVQYSSVPAGTLTWTDTAAPEYLKFYYSVAAFDSTNDSAHTAEAWGVSADNWRFMDAANGGTVRLADGTEVGVPGYGASQNDNILVVRLSAADYYGTAARVKADTGGARQTGIVYEIKFENPATRLLKPAVITLPYTAADIGSIPEANLRIYLLDGSRWVLVNTSRVQPETRRVTAEVNHFSVYSVMGYVPSGALLSADSVYTYPNPARGDTVTFKFLPADAADVTVDVYNVAGEKVARLEKAACPGGVTSEIVWNVGNVASGVYIYRLEARSASGKKAVTKKLAVVH